MNIEEQMKDAAATVIGIAPRTHRTVPCVNGYVLLYPGEYDIYSLNKKWRW